MTEPTKPIWEPYDPFSVCNEFGWLWLDDAMPGEQWALIYTRDPHNPAEMLAIIFLDDRAPPADAEDYTGWPYFSCSAPTAEPGKFDALEVSIRLEDGATVTQAFGDAAEARQLRDSLFTVLRRDTSDDAARAIETEPAKRRA